MTREPEQRSWRAECFPRQGGIGVAVLVVSDIRLYRDGLAELLDRESALCVVGSAASVAAALTLMAARRTGVILVDMALSEPLAAVATLAAAVPGARIIAVTVPEREADVLACIEAGAFGYVSREASLQELVKAVISAANGETLCSPRIAAVLVRRVAVLAASRLPDQWVRLTPREQQVVALVVDGLSNKQIARRLSIELTTVKNHMHNILGKLEARSRTEVAAAIGHGTRSAPQVKAGLGQV
jgi:two-component system nitrate/nitrite response regulator NarL